MAEKFKIKIENPCDKPKNVTSELKRIKLKL